MPTREVWKETNTADTLTLDIAASGTVTNKFPLRKPISLWYFVMVALEN